MDRLKTMERTRSKQDATTMKAVLKRYGMALFLLLAVSFLMLLGTMGVSMLGKKMFKDSGIEMKPRGENLTK